MLDAPTHPFHPFARLLAIMSAHPSLAQRPEIGVMIMNLYECLGVEVSLNATVACGKWIYLG